MNRISSRLIKLAKDRPKPDYMPFSMKSDITDTHKELAFKTMYKNKTLGIGRLSKERFRYQASTTPNIKISSKKTAPASGYISN